MHNILITSAGQRVSLVRAFQKELRAFDNKAKVYTVDMNPILAPACHVSDGYRKIAGVTNKEYMTQLFEICKEWNIGMIVPTIDTELLILAANKPMLKENGIIPIISSEKFVKICRDKRIINDFFSQKKIPSPQIMNKENPTFPLFIKPYDGSRSKDTFIIKSPKELQPDHYSNQKLIFMEYIDPEEHDEYTVDAYYNQKGFLCCVVPRKRIFVRSGEINKGVTRKNKIVPLFKEKLSFIEGAVGCLTIQFFLNKKTESAIGIEINPRFGGGFPLSYLAGANYPQWLIKEYFLNEDINYFEDWENNLLMLRYDDEILIKNYVD